MKRRLTRLVFDDGSFESLDSLRQKGVAVDTIEAALAGTILGSAGVPPVVAGVPLETPPETPFKLDPEPQITIPPAAADPDKALWQQLRDFACPCGKYHKPRWYFFCVVCARALPTEITELLAEIERLTGEAAVPDSLAADIPRRYRLALTFLRLPEPALRTP